MASKLKDDLVTLVQSKYKSAKSSGDLVFTPSQLATPRIGGVQVQLRFCPSLANKPVAKVSADEKKPKTFDPFADPSPELLITRIPTQHPSHNVVLNKFPVIENHFILATIANKQQTRLLEPDDLFLAYECIKEWSQSDSPSAATSRLFAFFNSGEFSGASQPHRHLQLLPIEDMQKGSGNDWVLWMDLIEKGEESHTHGLRCCDKLPFVHFAHTISPSCEANLLWLIYIKLYSAAAASLRRFSAVHEDELHLHPTIAGDLPISYNLAITRDLMAICPRRSEGRMVTRENGTDVSWAALNGTLLAGTLMVKNEEVFDLLQADEQQLSKIFEGAGIPFGQGFEELEPQDLDPLNFEELRGVAANL